MYQGRSPISGLTATPALSGVGSRPTSRSYGGSAYSPRSFSPVSTLRSPSSASASTLRSPSAASASYTGVSPGRERGRSRSPLASRRSPTSREPNVTPSLQSVGLSGYRTTSPTVVPTGTIIVDPNVSSILPSMPMSAPTSPVSPVSRSSPSCIPAGLVLYYPHDSEDYFTVVVYNPATLDGKSYIYWLLLNVPQTDIENGYELITQELPTRSSDNIFVVDVHKQPNVFSGRLPAPFVDRVIDLTGFIRDNGLALVSRATLSGYDSERTIGAPITFR